MKRSVLLAVAIVGVGGVFAAKSFVYAADKAEPIQPPATQAELDDEATWDAWRNDFAALLDEDPEYIATTEAVLDVPFGDEYDEAYKEAEAVRDARYREIGRTLYEQHFGVWTGDDAEFDDLLASKAKPDTPAMSCAKAALVACGRGRVCSATQGEGTCSFVCAVGGNCPKETEGT